MTDTLERKKYYWNRKYTKANGEVVYHKTFRYYNYQKKEKTQSRTAQNKERAQTISSIRTKLRDMDLQQLKHIMATI